VIKTADWIIDLGPEGGDKGGYIVAEGTPEQVSAIEGSYTGCFLREMLGEVWATFATVQEYHNNKTRIGTSPAPTVKS